MSNTQNLKPESHQPSLSLVARVMYLTGIAIYATMYIPQPILPVLSREFGVPPATAALSVSLPLFFVALASNVYGAMGSRYGLRRVMILSCLALAATTALSALSVSFPLFLVFRALQGIALPGVASLAVAYIGDVFDDGSVGRVVGTYIGATVLGGMTGRVVSGLIETWFGWHAPFIFFGVVTALNALLMAQLLPTDRVHIRQKTTNQLSEIWRLLRNPILLGSFLVGGCVFFAFISVFTYFPYYLTGKPFEMPQSLVSFAYAAYIAGVFASPVAGRLSLRIPRPKLMAAGLVIAALGIAMTAVQWLPAVILGALVLCVGMFTAHSTAPAHAHTAALPPDRASVSALYLTFYYIGATLGSFLPGLAWQAFGWMGVAVCAWLALLMGLWAARMTSKGTGV